MKGLLRKELYGLWSFYRKTLPMIALLYAVLVLTTGNDFFLYFGVWVMMFYSVSTLSLDDSSGWNRYAKTLPVSAVQVVGAKFLASLIYVGFGLIYGTVIGVARRMIAGEGDYAGLVAGLVVVTLITSVMMFAMYPFSFRFGLEKARNGLLVVWVAVFGGIFLFGKQLDAVLPLDAVLASMETNPMAWAGGFIAGSLAIMVLCFFACCRIYRKKEF